MIKSQGIIELIADDLRRRVESGEFLSDGQFPDENKISERYGVNRRAAHRALLRLCDEGVITLSRRAAPRLASAVPRQKKSAELIDALEKRELICEVYDAAALVLPTMLTAFSLKLNAQSIPRFSQAKRPALRGLRPSDWRCLHMLCLDILRKSGNFIACEVYLSLIKASKFSFFFEEREQLYELLKEPIREYFRRYETAEPSERAGMLADILYSARECVCASLTQLGQKYPYAAHDTGKKAQLKPLSIKTNKYSPVAADLIFTLAAHRPEYLPSREQIMRRYGVTRTTAERAVTRITELGYCEEPDAEGRRKVCVSASAAQRMINDPAVRKYAVIYLRSLELMGIIIRPCARHTAALLTEEGRRSLLSAAQKSEKRALSHAAWLIAQRCDVSPLGEILRSLLKIIGSSPLTAFPFVGDKNGEKVAYLAQKLSQSLKNGDSDALSDALSQFYFTMLSGASAFFAMHGSQKSDSFITSLDF